MSDENCRENRGGGPKHVQGGRQQKRGLQMGGCALGVETRT